MVVSLHYLAPPCRRVSNFRITWPVKKSNYLTPILICKKKFQNISIIETSLKSLKTPKSPEGDFPKLLIFSTSSVS